MSVRRNGVDEPYHSDRRSNGVAVYLGRKDYFLPPGEYIYEIRYRTDRQLGFFADHDELYWNVTGVDWDFPIDSATAQVQLPGGNSARRGAAGGLHRPDGGNLEALPGTVARTAAPLFETTRPLGHHEGLTIVVAWPKGYVAAPGELAQLGYFLRDNRPLTYGALGLIALLGYYVSSGTASGVIRRAAW